MTDDDLVEALDEEAEGLTPWEIEFVEKLVTRRNLPRSADDDNFLTEKQRKKAQQIYEERCQ